jgi:hypothetical protein
VKFLAIFTLYLSPLFSNRYILKKIFKFFEKFGLNSPKKFFGLFSAKNSTSQKIGKGQEFSPPKILTAQNFVKRVFKSF